MNIETKNAVITSAEIDCERGLSAWLHLEYGSCGQGFGGYALHLPKDWKHHKIKSPYAGHFIQRCLEIAGVEKWSQLKGKCIRVQADWEKVHAIGHIIKDDWFNPTEDFASIQRVENGHQIDKKPVLKE